MRLRRTGAVDGFELAYARHGQSSAAAPSAVLLHGWPGDHGDYREVVPLLTGSLDVVVPDLRGFGDSARGPETAPVEQYGAQGQARSVAELIEQLELDRPVVAGYDVGSRVAQALAAARPELVGALVLGPPLPGAGERVLNPRAHLEFWYQAFHQLRLAERLVDGKPEAVRDYLTHFWTHWSGPDHTPDPSHMERLVAAYSRPGAFTESISWYRAGGGTVAASVAESAPSAAERISTPTAVLWPEHDPLFPRAWSDHISDFFTHARLQLVDGAGHFLPLEAPGAFAAAIAASNVSE